MTQARVPVLIGRERELQRLDSVLARAVEGGATTAIVGGEAGVGKSRLVRAFADRASATGCRVLVGSCLELGERGGPYAPFVEVFRMLARTVGPGELLALLGPGRGELSRLLPELGGRPGASQPLDESAREAQARLFELTLGVLERLARSGRLIVVIEDVHWSDQSTRDLLSFLVRVLRQPAVMFVVTARSDELAAQPAVLSCLAELERLEHVERIEVPPFGRAEVALHVRALTGSVPSDEQVEAVADRTDGNPFFIEQVVAAHAESLGRDIPLRLQDVLRARIARLSPHAQEVLRAASAAGPRIDDELLTGVVDLAPRELHEALRELVDRQVLVPVESEGGEFRHEFHHALMKEVVYGELFAGERTRLHAAYARMLSARAADGAASGAVPPTAAELAYHWQAARDHVRALPAAVAAGDAAERVYAFADALRQFERALAVWDRVPNAAGLVGVDRASLLGRAAETAVLSGEYQSAVELGRAALASLPADADLARVGRCHERLRWFLYEAGDQAGAAEALREADRLVPAEPPSGLRAVILAHEAGMHMMAGRLTRSRDAAREAIAIARAAGTRPQEALALGILGWSLAMLGDIEGGIARYREGLGIAEEASGTEGVGLGYSHLAQLLDRVGRAEEALAIAREGYERAVRLGLVRTYGGLLLASMASAQLATGDWDGAEEATSEGLERLPGGRAAIALHLERARLDIGRGRLEEAEAHLGTAAAGEARLGGTEYRVALHAAATELACARGRLAECREQVTASLRDAADGPVEPALGWLGALGLRAEADAAERARALHDDEGEADARARAVALARRLREPAVTSQVGIVPEPEVRLRLEALASLWGAEVARAEGSDTPVAWREAAGRHEALGRPYPAAWAWYRAGAAVLAGRGQRPDAASDLRCAHRIARRLRAEPLQREIEVLARQARLELEREGGPAADVEPGTEASGGSRAAVDALGLTAREVEVLRLVAQGWTNQRIADHLFIARKTASVHVSNILGKLGVSNRVEAASVAHRLGLSVAGPSPAEDPR